MNKFPSNNVLQTRNPQKIYICFTVSRDNGKRVITSYMLLCVNELRNHLVTRGISSHVDCIHIHKYQYFFHFPWEMKRNQKTYNFTDEFCIVFFTKLCYEDIHNHENCNMFVFTAHAVCRETVCDPHLVAPALCQLGWVWVVVADNMTLWKRSLFTILALCYQSNFTSLLMVVTKTLWFRNFFVSKCTE